MTGEWFVASVEQILVPTLRPGDVVILDNLPAQNSADARDAIEAVVAHLLFLPPPASAWAGSIRQASIQADAALETLKLAHQNACFHREIG